MTEETSDKTADSSQNQNEEQVKKLKYPRAIPFIISNEFCERFNYYGMRTILVLFLSQKLLYDDNSATVIYHSFSLMVYFCCIFGAIIADSCLGKFRTITIFSIVYAFGSSIITVGAMHPWKLPREEVTNLVGTSRALTFIGLLLIAFGAGGIKPCVAAFGAEQFKLPEQEKQTAKYFSAFYFAINFGSLISTLVTPILRDDIHCFDNYDCFSAGFGLPAALMILSIIIFVCGKPLYKMVPNRGNMFLKVCKCIGNGIKNSSRATPTYPKCHWLDYAEPKYGKKLVMETKILLNILVLYLPLPLFWALFDQQGSRWTIQATRMDGELSFYTIKPDQMQVINPVLVLLMIPLYAFAIKPLLKRVGIQRPLQHMALGGILAGISFLSSMLVQQTIERSHPETVSILLQLPQYILMTMGEVLFSITGLEFSFTQAPQSMKSVIQACWCLTTAFGNLIVVFIAGTNFIENRAMEFLLFAILMFVDMMIFMVLAKLFKPIPLEEVDEMED